MRFDARQCAWVKMNIKGIKGYFTDEKVIKGSVPKQFNLYELAGHDGIPYKYALVIPVSFYGTFISIKELPVDNENYKFGFIKPDEVTIYNLSLTFNTVLNEALGSTSKMHEKENEDTILLFKAIDIINNSYYENNKVELKEEQHIASDNIKAMIKKCEKSNELYGFNIHCVIGDNDDEFIEMHTHNILKQFGHLDFQIVNPGCLSIDDGKKILDLFASSVINLGDEYKYLDSTIIELDENICATLKITKDIEFDRMILRIIIPDEKGLYPWDELCDDNYKKQFTEYDILYNEYAMNL